MSAPDAEGNVHWYYRAEGKDQGPVLLSRLRQMAHQGRLTAGDLVRRGKTGEWRPAGGYPEIEVNNEQRAEAGLVVDVVQLPQVAPVPQTNRLRELVETFRERVSDFFFDLRWAFSTRTSLVRDALRYIALVAIGVILVWTASRMGALKWSKPFDPYKTCRSLWDELRQLREKDADSDTWKKFADRGRETLTPIVARLTREASSQNRKAQLLLWGTRDCLLKMFDDARKEASDSEKMLGEYLENVDRLASGEDIYLRNSRDIVRYNLKTKPLVKSWFEEDLTTAWLTIAVSALNVGLLSWAAWGILRKRMLGR